VARPSPRGDQAAIVSGHNSCQRERPGARDIDRLLRDTHRRLPLLQEKDIDMGLCLPPSLSEETLQGFKYFRLLGPLFDHLHRAADGAGPRGNRQLFLRSVCQLAVVYFFKPSGDQLAGLQQTTTLATVQGAPRRPPRSLSALS